MFKLNIASRKSRLALLQVKEAMSFYPELTYKIIEIDSYGDKHKEVSLLDGVAADFFTREIDSALLEKKVDLAVHSAKDLPFPLPKGLELFCLQPAFDQSDCLVSCNNITLENLPPGARIGTSSEHRKKQILAIRSDLTIISIRGTIEERIAQVDNGHVDALITATCALQRLGLNKRITEILPISTHPLQGNLAIVGPGNSDELFHFFNKNDIRKSFGKVYLVGAGPGAADLLTLRAHNILQNADVIIYDNLVEDSLLEQYKTKKVYAGKRKNHKEFQQSEINELLYQEALTGKTIVRLKGGDPLLFSRGGEEIQYLQERCIPVAVVPGISAFQAAGADCLIPYTQRGVSKTLHLLSGHYVKDEQLPALPNKNGTLIFYMTASKRAETKQRLLNNNYPGDTPVLLIENSARPQEKINKTTISQMDTGNFASPLLIIVGDVCTNYYHQKKILYTGLNPAACRLQGQIIHYPLIQVQGNNHTINLNNFQAVLFTSKNSVLFFNELHALKNKTVIAIGAGTKKALEQKGVHVDYVSPYPDSDELAKYINSLNFSSILYPCSQLSDNRLHTMKQIIPVITYTTSFVQHPQLDLTSFDGIVFSSPSTIDSFFELYHTIPNNLHCYVYGKHSEKRLKEKGYQSHVQTLPTS